MKPLIHLILLAALLCGCAGKTYSESQHAATTGLALTEQGIADAQDDNRDLTGTASGINKVILTHQMRSLNTAMSGAKQADKAQAEQTKTYWALFRENRDHEQELSRFFSPMQRHLWWLALTLWAAFGALAIVLDVVFKLSGASAFLMRFLPFSNVFALIRDRIKRSQAPTVNVNIENAPAGSVTTTAGAQPCGPESDPVMLKPQLPRRKGGK